MAVPSEQAPRARPEVVAQDEAVSEAVEAIRRMLANPRRTRR